MKITDKSEGDLDKKIAENPEDRLTFQAVNTDKDKLFDPSLLKVKVVTGEVSEEINGIIEKPLNQTIETDPTNKLNQSGQFKIVKPTVSDTVHTAFINAENAEGLKKKISDILTNFGVGKEHLEEVVSLIEDIGGFLTPIIEEKWADFILLKSYNTEIKLKKLFEDTKKYNSAKEEIKESVKKISSLSGIDNTTIRDIIISIYKEQLVAQYKNNKEHYFEKLKTVSKIDIGGDAISNFNKISTLSAEELREIFGYAKDVSELDTSGYNLDLLDKEQLDAIFSNFTNAKTVSLNGSFSKIGKEKQEIIFKNLHNCDTLNFMENTVTDDTIDLMVKYLKNIKSIDFTMCGLTPEEIESIKNKFPTVDIIDELLDDDIYLDVEGK